MRISRLRVTLLAILVGAIFAALLLQIEREDARLRDLQRTAQTLTVQNQRLGAVLQEAPTRPVVEQVETNAADLAREMEARKGSVESAAVLPGELRPGMESLKALIYAGNSTPLAAIDSSLWAVYHSDIDQLAKLIALTPAGKDAAAALFASLPAESQARMQDPEHMTALLVAYGCNAVGYQVQASHQSGGDPASWTVRVLVQSEDGRSSGLNIPLRQTGGSWQLECDQGEVKQLAALLNGELGNKVH